MLKACNCMSCKQVILREREREQRLLCQENVQHFLMWDIVISVAVVANFSCQFFWGKCNTGDVMNKFNTVACGDAVKL